MGITPVILCGGSGTRLWPLSRPARPKPFLPLLGEETLFEATVARCSGEPFAPPLLVAGAGQLALVESQAGGELGEIVVEPAAKSTAPAIALAAARLPKDAVMLVCPCDHHIADARAFRDAAAKAAALAEAGWLVAFGIAPDRAETGYGYIQVGEALSGGFRVERFVEKPDRTRAEAFLEDGGYCWNGGIFAFRAGTFLEELAMHRPEMAEAARDAAVRGRQEGVRFHPDSAAFAQIEAESVDYAVMEETARAAMVEADMGWSDIGNWQALRDARQGDAEGNIVAGPADLIDCRKVMVESDGPRVSVVGLDDVIVVVNGGEVLVTSGKGAAEVGKLKGAKGG
ncbi:MAG TPA: sugar phosphate nucleotidyltransferase [Sphingomonadaceae bacterium]